MGNIVLIKPPDSTFKEIETQSGPMSHRNLMSDSRPKSRFFNSWNIRDVAVFVEQKGGQHGYMGFSVEVL